MKNLLSVFCFLLIFASAQAQLTPFEKDPQKNTTATYAQIVNYYQALDKQYDQLKVYNIGTTDIGKPLQLIVLSRDKVFDPAIIKKQNKRVILINNGIHPGEPEGIDASMMLVRNLLKKNTLPKNVVVCMIAVYNIGGCLNRGLSRVNQNGPAAYGFRGNARNLDLNRDFIKADSKNVLGFMQIVNIWKPDVFLDNHTSDGADYQYVMTLIETQHNKQNPVLADYTAKTLTPELFLRMKKSGFEMTPYVESEGATPDSGLVAFLETPRYSSGFMAQHNIISYITETHMLKTYAPRVISTYDFMQHLIDIVQRDAVFIGKIKAQADAEVKNQKTFALNWELDKNDFDTLTFNGFTAGYKPSEVSGLPRLYYDRSKPFTKNIRYYNTYKATVSAEKPIAYIIPQAWGKVIDLLGRNGVKTHRLQSDTTISVQTYYITDYKTPPRPFEGHYLHSNEKVSVKTASLKFYAGDVVVYTDQPLNRYIVETLEPQGVDSFFAWNFFDSILGQKEYFSDYVFEDVAADLLKKNPQLKQKLETEKVKNPELAKSAAAQLNFVYKNSAYFEPTFMRYPISRLVVPIKLNLD
ncbi:M14 family zinc carboxypeptidase [Mucilaginibacter sp.]|uniref:M14 family zinc carboxypeptidase n=1 Tax=Mucilaginibacter sp. TaxID=1882438 RepID=UPI003B006F93